MPDKSRFLPGAETAVADPARLPTETVTLVVLDCGEFERTGLPEYPFRALPTINIDHHRTSQGFGEASYIDSAAAATGELVLAVLSGLTCNWMLISLLVSTPPSPATPAFPI